MMLQISTSDLVIVSHECRLSHLLTVGISFICFHFSVVLIVIVLNSCTPICNQQIYSQLYSTVVLPVELIEYVQLL